MGSVHIAHDRRTRAVVALKRIHEKYASQKQTLRRFTIEIQAASRLRHPNIVSMIASGTEPRGTPFCVMEWVQGKSLEYWASGQLRWPEVSWIMSDLLDALAYAHARGVVHRDLKPANILIQAPASDRPLLRLVDFGIARLMEPEERDAEATALTMDDRVVGTPAYLSPEQAQGQAHLVGPHTDLYSLGVILYELINGHLPFHSMAVVQLLLAHASKPAPPLDLSGRPDVPREVAAVVRWLLEKSPDARPQSAHEVRDALKLPEKVARYPLVMPQGEETRPITSESFQPTVVGPVATHRTEPMGDAGQPAGALSGSAAPMSGAGELALVQQYIPERVTLVGRATELDWLMDLARQIRQAGCSGLAVVHGEAGIGKSRLVQELRYRLEESGTFRGARLLGRSGVSDDEAIRSMIARLLLAERLRGDVLRERIKAVASLYYFSPLQVQALTAWLSDDDRNRAEAADRIDLASRVLRKIAIHKPLVCIFEGGDLAGSSFALSVLEKTLLAEEKNAVFYAVVTSREPLDRLPLSIQSLYGRLGAEGRAIEIQLGPLKVEDLSELIRPFLATHADEIAHSAKGSPLFALELARLRAGATLATTDQLLAVPDSLKEIWKRRVDRTLQIAKDPALARNVLIAASLLGPFVRRRILVSVVAQATGESAETVESAIDIWTSTGVLMDDGRRDPALSFVHTLAYEHVVDSIDPNDPPSAALLVRIADWVGQRRAGMDPEVLSMLARILETGRDLTRANQIRLLVGEILVGRLEYQGAQVELEKLLESASRLHDEALEIRATSDLANLAILRGNLPQAEQRLAQLAPPPAEHFAAEATASLSPEEVAWVGWYQAKANLALAQGHADQAVSLLDQAVLLAKRAEDPLGLAHVRTQLSNALKQAGRLADAERQCRLAIRTMEQSEAPERMRARAYVELAFLCHQQGRIAEATEAANQALPLAERAGDRQQVDRALDALSRLADDRGDTDDAVHFAERILEQQKTFGDQVGIIRTENTLGVLERHRANLAEAQIHHQMCLQLLETLPDRRMLAITCENLGLLEARRGNLGEATELLQEAADMFDELGERADLGRIWCHLARVLRARRKSVKAEQLARQGVRTLIDLADLSQAAHGQIALALLAADNDNWHTARELFQEARNAFAAMGISRHLVLAEIWLALADVQLGNLQAAHMLARDLEERLRQRPVYRNLVVEGLERLAETMTTQDRELGWRLQDRASAIAQRLGRS
ncbi:MAG: tetratricopeptide repeat protein [Bradymonadales bacterium]|nr:tetratricopeptide repeat protein [Bradymonadales bacterium]